MPSQFLYRAEVHSGWFSQGEDPRFLDGNIMTVGPIFIVKEACGIRDTSFQSIMKHDVDTRMSLCGNVVLSGGTTIFQGTSLRMTKGSTALALRTVPIGHFGRSILCSLSTLLFMWISISAILFWDGGEEGLWVRKPCRPSLSSPHVTTTD